MRTAPPGPRSGRDAVAWWERRRPAYNAFLAAVGLPGLALYAGAAPAADELVLAAVAGWVLANALYTLTWLVELRDRQLAPRDVDDAAVYAFLVDAILLLTGLAVAAPALWQLAFALRHHAGGHG